MQLDTGKTIQGKAGTNSAITYTITGDVKTSGVDSYQIAVQGQLSTSAATPLYTVPASAQLLISTIKLSNTTASPVTGVTVYVGGSAATNQTDAFTIPASGNATSKAGAAFVVTDINGATQTTTAVVLSTDATGTLANGTLPMTLNTVNANTGSFGTASNVGQFSVNGKGLTTAAANVPIVIAESAVTNLTTDLAAKAPTSRLINTTAPITGGGDLSADRTLAISAASTSAAGSMSAIDKNTVNNVWYDVTNYGVSISNSGATNVAAMNTLIQTTAGGPFTFFFPSTGANYPMAGTITVTKNGQTFAGHGMRSSVIFGGNTTQDLFFITDAVTNITFQDLGFWSTATATAGSVINCGTVSGTGNQQVNIYRCGMEGFGGNWFNGFLFNGTRGGEVSNIEDCVMNSFTNYGVGVVGNTTIPNTTSALTMTNVLMNGSITGTTGAVAGIYQQQCGALQINSCDIIQCTNNLLTAPITSTSQVVASVYAVNSYFDASHGSCVKFGGTQPTVRCKLVSCSMTIAADSAANYSAIEFSNTATNPPGDIDILNCNVQNTFNNTATTNGILLTAAANVKIIGNNINGFTNNLQASAAAGSATKLNIVGNSFGPGTVSASASTNDILLNSGTYGYIQITTNVFAPTSSFQTTSTNHINDSSTVANSSFKRFGDNIGIANTGYQASIPTAAQSFTASADNVITGTLIPLPTNGLLVSQKFRGDFRIDKTAAGAAVWSLKVKFGTNGTAADAAIATWTSGTNTALADTAYLTIFVEVTAVGATATVKGYCTYFHTPGAAATGLGVLTIGTTSTATFNLSSASPFLHVDCTPGASAVMTGLGTFGQIA